MQYHSKTLSDKQNKVVHTKRVYGQISHFHYHCCWLIIIRDVILFILFLEVKGRVNAPLSFCVHHPA